MRLKLMAALLLAVAVVTAPPASGQQANALRGRVVDEAGAPLHGAQVYVPTARRGTLTDERGEFVLSGLAGGRPTEVRVTLIGYAPGRVVTRVGGSPLAVVLRQTPLTLPGLDVTATPGGRDALAVTQATSQLAGPELERELSGSLAQSLRMQPGVAVRFMGPAATMPVLRGLTGDRVLVLQDGQRTADLAGSADDHGVTIDPLAAQRVEIVRGPATLLYGNNAVGGVVNVISGDVPASLPTRPEGTLGLQSESAFPGGAASGRVAMPLGASWVTTLRAAVRTTEAMRIPHDPLLGTRLENTEASNVGGSFGIGRVGERVSAGVAMRAYGFAYGLPVAPGTDPVGLRGSRYEMSGRAEVTPGTGALTAARLDLTVQDYGHDELDDRSGDLLQEFGLHTRTANVLVQHGRLGPLAEGAWGASVLTKRYAATGPQALTPPADSRGLGMFVFQEVRLSQGGMALQVGGRLDDYRIESGSAPKFGPGVDRHYQALSGALGLRLPLSSTASAAVHVGRSFRAPTVEELFSAAAHAGTGAVEIGDPALQAETGVSVEATVRVRNPRWNGQLSVYRNEIDGFVHLAARGDTVLGGATLPVLQYAQRPAVLRGAEGSLEWAASRAVVLGVMGDYLHAEMTNGRPLSFMPPPRLGVMARWDGGLLSFGGDLHHELAQERVGAAGERPTPAHTIARLHAGLRFRTGNRTHSLTVRAENLANELHREATSRVKDFAPGPGRNISVGYRLYY